MPRLYLRRVVLEIVPKAGPRVRIDGLRIKFRIEKNSQGTPNKSEITIYNLSQKTLGLLQTVNTKIILYAGYQSTFPINGLSQTQANPVVGPPALQTDTSLEVIFKGDITKTAHKKSKKIPNDPFLTKESKEGVDILTEIEAQDGIVAFRNSRFVRSYPPGASNKQIFQDIAESSGVPIGALDGIPDFIYAKGVTFQGLVRDHLFRLTDSNNLDWSFQDETLLILEKGKVTKDPVIVLNSNTGLIGIPIKTSRGCEFRALLQAGFKIGRQVDINESKFVQGKFKIMKLTHNGDNWGGDFVTECEAYRI